MLLDLIGYVKVYIAFDAWDLAAARVLPPRYITVNIRLVFLIRLIIKPQKTGGDFKEIDLLGRQIERLARVNRYSQTGNEADLNPNVANRNKGGRRKPKKNFFSDEAIEKLEQIFFEQSFDYQLHWYRAGLEHRIRDILKSRQIGATFYFSREALCAPVKPVITRFSVGQLKRRRMCSANTSSPLPGWLTLTDR